MATPPPETTAPRPPEVKDRASALALDREGARAYAEGRYRDAAVFFEEAYRFGAPPVELWNIAKCQLKLDDADSAAKNIERYLGTPNIPERDRADAQRQLEELNGRSSTVTVVTVPTGSTVTIDDRAIEGTTPLVTTLPSGWHTIEVRFPSGDRSKGSFQTRYGRALVVRAFAESSGAGE